MKKRISKKPSVIAVFVNWNNGQDVIDSCKTILSYNDVEKTIVVDNGSTDNSLTLLKKSYSKQLVIIENGTNLGFAKAANRGIKKALELGADYIIVLNPDLIFKKGFIAKLIKSGLDMAQVGLKFKRDGQWVYGFGGKINWVLGRSWYMENNKPVHPMPGTPVDYVSGGATLVKREVYEKVGLFDERFFMYFEDADLSLRAKKMGYSMGMVEDFFIEHKLEIHKVTKNWGKMKKNLKSNFQFIDKCVPWYFKPTAYAYWFILAVKSWLSTVV